MKEKVLVLGASENPERYSHQAMRMLEQYGHEPVLVNPKGGVVEGRKVYRSLEEVDVPVTTLTVYVGPAISSNLQRQILSLQGIRRVIFNPGSENPALQESLRQAGLEVEDACTLVLLRTSQFEIAAKPGGIV